MTVERTTLATFLLEGHLPSGEIAAALLRESNKNDFAMATAPQGTTVSDSVKSHWTRAAAVTRVTTDPGVLDVAARTSSIVVRRLVAANVNISEATVTRLLSHALKKLDTDLFTNLCNNPAVSPAAIAAPLTVDTRSFAWVSAPQVAAKVCGNRAAVLKLLKSSPNHVREALLCKVAKRETPLGYIEAVRKSPPDMEGSTVVVIARGVTIVDDEVVDLLDTYKMLPATQAPVESWMAFPLAQSMTPTAGRRLFAGSPTTVDTVSVKIIAPELFDTVIELAKFSTLRDLLQRRVEDLSVAQIARLVERGAQMCGGDPEYKYATTPALFNIGLLEARGDIDHTTTMTYLRHAVGDGLIHFAEGKLKVKPLPGDLAALIKEPGWAFGCELNHATRKFEAKQLETYLGVLVHALVTSEVEQFVADEVIDGCGAAGFAALAGRRWGADGRDYLIDRVTRELGDDLDGWMTALDMMTRSATSLGATLATVRRLRGIEKPVVVEEPEQEPDMVFPMDEDGQIRIV